MAVKWLLKHSKKHIPSIIFVSFLNGAYAIVNILFALFCKNIIDSAVSGDHKRLILYSGLMFFVIMTAFLIRILSNSIAEKVRVRLEITYRTIILESLCKKKYSDISKFHSGELLNRLFSDVSIISSSVTGIVPSLVLMVTQAVGALIILFVLSPLFTAVFFTGGILLVIATALFRSKMKSLHKLVQSKAGKVRSYIQEFLENILVIKVFQSEERVLKRSSVYQEEYYDAQMKRRRISILAGACMGFAFEFAYLAALYIGATSLMSGSMTYGTLTAILQLIGQVQRPLSNLSGLIPQYYQMTASTERLMELENLENESLAALENSENISDYYKHMVKLECRNVSFSYGRNTILDNTDFIVNKGDFVSISGVSGGGKTSLFLLLMGAYLPSSGSLRISTDKGEDIPLGKNTRGLFAWVPQGNYIFSGTLRENITFLNDKVSDHMIKKAIHIACAEDFIDTLPLGLDTVLGERGNGLSEGQIQRIAIARAILSNADILMFDEATSALDEETELRVLENISGLKDKTCIIVTHRKAAINYCNRHYYLENGRLEEREYVSN